MLRTTLSNATALSMWQLRSKRLLLTLTLSPYARKALGGERKNAQTPNPKPQTPNTFPIHPFFSPIAFSSLGGDIGICVMCTPVADAMALATVAKGGTIGVSPTPRTP